MASDHCPHGLRVDEACEGCQEELFRAHGWPQDWQEARAWQAFRDFLNGVDDGEMVDWRHALRECRINSYREGAEHANLAWTTGVRKR